MKKILHYLYGVPPVRGGGLINYVFDLAEEQRTYGFDVTLLAPGTIYARNSSKIRISRRSKIRDLTIYYIQNPLPIPLAEGIKDIDWYTNDCGMEVYTRFLSAVSPDVIHVHSLMGIHRSFFRAAKELSIRIVYTSHDYFGICPKTNLLKNGVLCTEKTWRNCSVCCENAFGTAHLLLDQSLPWKLLMYMPFALKLIQKAAAIKKEWKGKEIVDRKGRGEAKATEEAAYLKLQKYYLEIWKMIDFYHFNSMVSKAEFEERIGHTESAVIPILNRQCGDHRKKRTYDHPVRFGFLGNQSIYKGYDILVKALDNLAELDYKFLLNIYFQPECRKNYIVENKPYKAANLEKVFDENDVIVVPSVWKETFGLIVTEALSYAVPVLVSENVGAGLLLEESLQPLGMIYDAAENGLECALKSVLDNPHILEQWNENICREQMNFSMKKHVEEIAAKCYGGNECGKKRNINL